MATARKSSASGESRTSGSTTRSSSAKKAPAKKSATRKSAAKKSSGSQQDQERPAAKSAKPSAMKVARAAAAQLTELTGRRPEVVVGVERNDDGWQVELEVVESRRIPDSTDTRVPMVVRSAAASPSRSSTDHRISEASTEMNA